MPLLVDTYNVLHVSGVLPGHLAGLDASGLSSLIAHSRYRREKTALVCDGTVDPHIASSSTRLIRILSAGPGRTADDLIIHMVRCSSAPKSLTIVTEDREIIRAVRRRKCRTLSSRKFLEELARGARSPAKPALPSKPNRTDDGLRAELIDHAGDIRDIKAGELPPHLKEIFSPSPVRSSESKPRLPIVQAKSRSSEDSAPSFPRSLLEEAERIMREFENG